MIADEEVFVGLRGCRPSVCLSVCLSEMWTLQSLGQHCLKPVYILDFTGDFCRLLIIFANSLDPNQARQNVGPVLDQTCLTVLWYP